MKRPLTLYERVRRNTLAMAAVTTILIAAIVAVFAYPLAPDSSPDGNQMAVELSARPLGHRQTFLLVPKPQPPLPRSWTYRLFNGTPGPNLLVPMNAMWPKGDSLILAHYVDEGVEDTLSFPLSAFSIPPGIKDTLAFIQKERTASFTYWLGSDRYGRDILSRLLIGTRVSLSVGLVSVILSIGIGLVLGALAGWYGGWTDGAVMWLVNILWSIPTLLLVFAITLTIGKGFWEIFIAIGLTSWVSAARLIRGQVMQWKEMEFVTAAKALGFSDIRILARHILPNIAGPIMVIAAANFASAILIEAGLSFLGIGIQPPTPSWGLMIKEHYNFLLAQKPLPALIPGLAIMLLVWAFNVLGNALRDALDKR